MFADPGASKPDTARARMAAPSPIPTRPRPHLAGVVALLLAAFSFLLAPGAAAQDDSDENVPGVTVSPTYLNIPEGQERTYTIVLNTRPTAQVRVTLAVSGDQRNSASEFLCCRGSWAIFSPDTWNRPRTFRVAALEEPGTVDGTLWVRHWAESDDPNLPRHPRRHGDGEGEGQRRPRRPWAPASRCRRTSLRVPEGGSRTYTVVLNARPAGEREHTANDRLGRHGPERGATARHLPGVGLEHAAHLHGVRRAGQRPPADGTATITHAANSSDPGYDGNAVSIASVRATEQDDDRHGVTVSPTALAVARGRLADLHGGAEDAAERARDRASDDHGGRRPARDAGGADLHAGELERGAGVHGVGAQGRRRHRRHGHDHARRDRRRLQRHLHRLGVHMS